MRSTLKRIVKKTLLLLGLDVRWRVKHPPHELATLLELYRVGAVFDIGANIGMSGQYFRNIGFRDRIVSFEPVSHFYDQLERRTKKDRLWLCERAAVGDLVGEQVINVSGGSGGASSFLTMTDTLINNASELQYVRQERVKVETIDSVIDRYYPEGDRLFLKLDVQGFERNVLEGAKASLDRVVGMRIEMSIVKNYEEEPLIYEMLPYLYTLGFKLMGIEPAWSNTKTQEIYQVDGVLFRPDRLPSGAL